MSWRRHRASVFALLGVTLFTTVAVYVVLPGFLELPPSSLAAASSAALVLDLPARADWPDSVGAAAALPPPCPQRTFRLRAGDACRPLLDCAAIAASVTGRRAFTNGGVKTLSQCVRASPPTPPFPKAPLTLTQRGLRGGPRCFGRSSRG
jgi:hypothetical protein